LTTAVVYYSSMIVLLCTPGSFVSNDAATPDSYTLSLHDALPIYWRMSRPRVAPRAARMVTSRWRAAARTRQRLAMFIQARTRMEAARIRNNALARASMRGPAGPSDMLTGPSWMARSVSQASAFAF